MHDHTFWKNRYRFVLLIENLINEMIDAEGFSDSIYGPYRKIPDVHDIFKIDFEKLENFQPYLNDINMKLLKRMTTTTVRNGQRI